MCIVAKSAVFIEKIWQIGFPLQLLTYFVDGAKIV